MSDVIERLKTALADRYAVESEIGRGGMATVFLAEDLKHHRKVAIKVLHSELDATLRDRLERERSLPVGEAVQIARDVVVLARHSTPAQFYLGQIYEALEQPEKAMIHYDRFVTWWQESDPELRPWWEKGREAQLRLAGNTTKRATGLEPATFSLEG